MTAGMFDSLVMRRSLVLEKGAYSPRRSATPLGKVIENAGTNIGTLTGKKASGIEGVGFWMFYNAISENLARRGITPSAKD
jgi:hypothetical protein